MRAVGLITLLIGLAGLAATGYVHDDTNETEAALEEDYAALDEIFPDYPNAYRGNVAELTQMELALDDLQYLAVTQDESDHYERAQDHVTSAIVHELRLEKSRFIVKFGYPSGGAMAVLGIVLILIGVRLQTRAAAAREEAASA